MLELPNMDGMSEDELKELETVLGVAACYAGHKRLAMEYRTKGDIECGLAHERICDEMYEQLPQECRW